MPGYEPRIFFAYCNISLFNQNFELNQILNSIHPSWRSGVLKYRRIDDIKLSILGRLLLKHLLRKAGIEKYQQMYFSERGKPIFLNLPGIDFSISHSHAIAACALGIHIKLGIDLEYLRKIELSDFENSMSPAQWSNILKNENPEHEFFRYWTLKEAVIKADGRGMLIPLASISDGTYITVNEDLELQIAPMEIDPAYHCHIAHTGGKLIKISNMTPHYSEVLYPF